MNRINDNLLLAAGVLIPCCACVAAWLADPLIPGGSSTLRFGLMGGIVVLAGASAWLLVGRAKANRRALERHVEALCQVDAADLSGGRPDALANLSAEDPWSPIVRRLRDAIEAHAQQARELKHTQAAWEIRSRRAAAECERIKAILEGLAEPILVVDAFGELRLANPAAERLFQLEDGDVEGHDVGQLVRCPRLVELLRNACHRKTTTSRSEEVEIVDAEGTAKWYRVSVAKLPSHDGDGEEEDAPQRHGAVAVLRDVGREKALQKRHAEFVSSVSHEMKTPLAGIKAYVELLADGEAEDEATREEFLDVIDGQADRLQRLVENMLNLARIEAGVVSVNKQSRSLNELLEEAVHVVQPVAEAKPVELAAELSPMYLGVLADRDMLLQSAINLLSNAVKYTPPGGRVTLRSRLVGNEVAFEVEDTGVGLSEEDRRRVFEKFYRVKKDKSMASGTGLGLPLAKHIVEDVHGGRLTVDSTLGAGSTFSVVLPGVGQMA